MNLKRGEAAVLALTGLVAALAGGAWLAGPWFLALAGVVLVVAALLINVKE